MLSQVTNTSCLPLGLCSDCVRQTADGEVREPGIAAPVLVITKYSCGIQTGWDGTGVQGMDCISNYTLRIRATEAAKLKHLLIFHMAPVAPKGRFTKLEAWRSHHPGVIRRQPPKPLL